MGAAGDAGGHRLAILVFAGLLLAGPGEGKAMPAATTRGFPRAEIPPIDAAAPAVTETATFALG